MAERKIGSGLSTDTATAVETLLAGILAGRRSEIERAYDDLTREFDSGLCGVHPDRIVELLAAATAELGLSVAHARRALPGNPGDVAAVTTSGEKLWFEVKAQTKKSTFRDLTQADWVRDRTDAIRWVMTFDPEAAERIPRDTLALLKTTNSVLSGWTFADLWLADLGLVTDAPARQQAEIESRADLVDFLQRKFVVHLTAEGVRVARLSELEPVAAAIAGVPVNYVLRSNSKSLLALPVSVGRDESTVFTYHIYPPEMVGTVKGRHKLHARAFENGSYITVA